MKRPQLVPQGSLNRILQAAEQAWNNRDFQQNLEQLERASRLAPANTQILLQLGRVYGFRYDYAAAERSFEKAVRLASKKTEMLAAAAEMAVDFANPQLAERYFRHAAELPDISAQALVGFAEFYERLRRVQEAEGFIDRALHKEPGCASALLARARFNRTAGRLEDAEKIVQSAVAAPDKYTRVRAFYELGMILDRLGRYDDAMEAFVEAKTMLRADAAPLLAPYQNFRARLADMQARASAEMFGRWFNAAADLQPARRVALLCGHPRSGTTLLEQVLDSHPEIVSIEETDIITTYAYNPLARQFAGRPLMLDVLETAKMNALEQSRQNYFSTAELHLGSPLRGRLVIDKNPSFNFFIPVFARIFPEIKFLTALRDPRDVCLSCFMQPIVPLSQRSTCYLSIETTVEEYAWTMGIWKTLKPFVETRSLEVRYEDLVDDLESVARRVLEFLGVPWTADVLKFHEHAQKKAVRSPTYAEVAKPIFKRAMGRWKNYEKYLEPHLARLEPFAKAFGYD